MSDTARVHVVVAPVFGTNCCVVVAAAGGDGPRDCVIVDAGAGVAGAVARVVEEQDLRPRAVLATHGHVDHTWDAAELCERYDVPLWMHTADVYRIDDPFGTLGGRDAIVSGALGQELAGLGFSPEAYRAPAQVEGFGTDGGSADLTFGAVSLRAVHAPGHTEGSTLYLLDLPGRGGADDRAGTDTEADGVASDSGADDAASAAGVDGVTSDSGADDAAPAARADAVTPDSGADDAAPAVADGGTPDSGPSGIAFTGDVLFAGSIGRTDLPGADDATMRATLRDVVAHLDPRLAVVPGHGPTTTVGRELATNPFLG